MNRDQQREYDRLESSEPRSKLNEYDRAEIVAAFNSGVSKHQLAREYNRSWHMIHRIVKGGE